MNFKQMSALITLLVVTVLSWTKVSAQEMSVSSFRLLERDLSARGVEGKTDQNGDRCAIIKIVTTGTGFIFEPDALGIVEVVQKTGEVWLYLPYGARSLTIKHAQLGILRGYQYPVAIKEACVYEMVLTSDQVEVVVKKSVTDQWLVLKVLPTDALVFIDGSPKPLTNGSTQIFLPLGDHTYRVEHSDYHNQSGDFTIVSSKKTELTVELVPSFGTLIVNSSPEVGADVYINNKKVGKTPYTDVRRKSGEYQILLLHQSYKSESQTVTVNDGQTTNVNVPMSATFSLVTLEIMDHLCEIWLNKELMGRGTWSGTLNAGRYEVEVRKTSHRTVNQTIEVKENEPLTVKLNPPVPLYGILIISADPMGSRIKMDGVDMGEAPIVLNNVLIGNRSIELSKEGYITQTFVAQVEENKTREVNYTLTKRQKEVVVQGGESSNDKSMVVKVEGVIFSMIKVKGGTFLMGKDSKTDVYAGSNEMPVHRVTLSDYYIGLNEVTQALWKAVMGNNPSRFKGDNLPVECVSWESCYEFVQELNRLTGKNFALPTEAQWEYAARGGRVSNNSPYSGVNNLRQAGWSVANSEFQTHEVCLKTPNNLNLYDMSGNVWEWCSDWYGPYTSSDKRNPQGPDVGQFRVLRGGGWMSDAQQCRITARIYDRPDNFTSTGGFRLVLNP